MKIAIDGMHCQACVQRVRKALEKVEGAQVRGVEVGSADVAIDPAHEAAALEAVRKAGYEPRLSQMNRPE
jgi:copper chaperone